MLRLLPAGVCRLSVMRELITFFASSVCGATSGPGCTTEETSFEITNFVKRDTLASRNRSIENQLDNQIDPSFAKQTFLVVAQPRFHETFNFGFNNKVSRINYKENNNDNIIFIIIL